MAGVGFVLDVGHPVVVQVGAGCETLATGFTLVGPLACVYSPVCVQGGGGGEGLVTEVTGVGALSCVGPHMSLQQARPVEHLSTVVTGEGLLAEAGQLPQLLLLLLGGLVLSGGSWHIVFTAASVT